MGAFLKDGEVELRPVESHHLDFIREKVDDPEIRRPLGVRTPLRSPLPGSIRNRISNFLRKHLFSYREALPFMIYVEGEPCGMIGLKTIDYHDGEAVAQMWLVPEARGEGWGAKALDLMISYAFDELRLNRLTAFTRESNEPAIGILEGAGFVQEGAKRGSSYRDGSYADELVFGLLKRDSG